MWCPRNSSLIDTISETFSPLNAHKQRLLPKVQLLSPWDQRGSTPDWAETLGTKRYEATTFWPAVNLKAFFALQPVRQFAFRPHFTPISNYTRDIPSLTQLSCWLAQLSKSTQHEARRASEQPLPSTKTRIASHQPCIVAFHVHDVVHFVKSVACSAASPTTRDTAGFYPSNNHINFDTGCHFCGIPPVIVNDS
ncbi:hypothetical protein VTJ04DRAFT_9606 [Mycothermus thermophilus]|uniref:uncharacterized protein n=1 Tax=Humicola insolens TaxID=85995 RepID=UPI0037439301